MATTSSGWPYDQSSDTVYTYPARTQTLAEALEDRLGYGGLKLLATATPAAASTVSIDNVFTSDYSTYTAQIELTAASGSPVCSFRLRVATTDNTATEYDYSLMIDNPTIPASALITAQTSGAFAKVGTALSTCTLHLHRPAAAEPTAWRSHYQTNMASPLQGFYAGGHDVATAYDGLTIIPASSTITGVIRVYGHVT